MAPEMIQSTTGYDGMQTDVWSCGIMLYVMLFGYYPFETPPERTPEGGAGAMDEAVRNRICGQSLISRIIHMQWDLPSNKPVSPSCEDLLRRLIVQDPLKRLSIQEIKQHPWFLDNLPRNALAMTERFLNAPPPQRPG